MKADADSLKLQRLKKFKKQPNTCRGQCILRHAKLAGKPCLRYTILTVMSFAVFIHLVIFCLLLNKRLYKDDYDVSVGAIMTPILLLLLYPLIIIPLVLTCIAKDLIKKHEGFLTWHRSSVGDLVQRFTFTLLFISSISVLISCINANPDSTPAPDKVQRCVQSALVPLLIAVSCILLKIICLRGQSILLWTGFCVCLIMQQIIIKHVSLGGSLGKHNDEQVKKCLTFLPLLSFIALADIHAIIQTKKHKPVAYDDVPQAIRAFIVMLSYVSLIMTGVCYLVAILSFKNDTSDNKWLGFVFILKSACWSPFIALEYYDTIFEHLYWDVAFQIDKQPESSAVSTPETKSPSTNATPTDALLGPKIVSSQNEMLINMIENDDLLLADELDDDPPDSQKQENSSKNNAEYLIVPADELNTGVGKSDNTNTSSNLSILGGRTIKVTDRKSMALVNVDEEESPSKLFVQDVNELKASKPIALDYQQKRTLSNNDWESAAAAILQVNLNKKDQDEVKEVLQSPTETDKDIQNWYSSLDKSIDDKTNSRINGSEINNADST